MKFEDFVVDICHLAWVAFSIGAGQKFNSPLTEEQRKSQKDALKSYLKNPTITPEENHENWMKFKLSTGWTHGPKKDPARKEHPDLVPFKDLPEIEQRKDAVNLMAQRIAIDMYARFDDGCAVAKK